MNTKKAAAAIVKTGLGPSLRYGAGVVGASAAMIKQARRTTCSAISELRGRSQFARLKLTDYDIGALMATDPIIEWAKAVMGWSTGPPSESRGEQPLLRSARLRGRSRWSLGPQGP